MALPIRRRWVWLLGGLALLMILVYGAARFANEPLRRYMEAEVNRRLTGHTVRIAALHVYPWTASLELRGATIAQDVNPDPPVAQVARLVTRIDWRALLHRRVVADITFADAVFGATVAVAVRTALRCEECGRILVTAPERH